MDSLDLMVGGTSTLNGFEIAHTSDNKNGIALKLHTEQPESAYYKNIVLALSFPAANMIANALREDIENYLNGE